MLVDFSLYVFFEFLFPIGSFPLDFIKVAVNDRLKLSPSLHILRSTVVVVYYILEKSFVSLLLEFSKWSLFLSDTFWVFSLSLGFTIKTWSLNENFRHSLCWAHSGSFNLETHSFIHISSLFFFSVLHFWIPQQVDIGPPASYLGSDSLSLYFQSLFIFSTSYKIL